MTQPAISKSELNFDKIGNIIIYLVDKIKEKHRQDVYLTKLLKLLYIIDEISVEETAAPVTGLEYRVWKMGPVAFDVYSDFTHNLSEKLGFYAEAIGKNESSIIQSVNKFNDEDLSDYEVELLDRVIKQYGHLRGSDLISLLHEENSLWSNSVIENNLDFSTSNTSPYKIDLSNKLVEEYKKQLFFNSLNSLSI